MRRKTGHDEGGLLRDTFAAVSLTAECAQQWMELEWWVKPKVELAHERGWGGGRSDDDGSGSVEIAPGMWLELENDASRHVGSTDVVIVPSIQIAEP